MRATLISCLLSLLMTANVVAEEAPEGGDKLISGMSIVGNHEAPKSLVIVPWKSSELGTEPGVGGALDDERGPVDKEVFLRELDYYEIRSEELP